MVVPINEEKKEAEIYRLAELHLVDEIRPYLPDAWIDHSKTKIGYEIPFTRQFYKFITPRPVTDIRNELNELDNDIEKLMKGLL